MLLHQYKEQCYCINTRIMKKKISHTAGCKSFRKCTLQDFSACFSTVFKADSTIIWGKFDYKENGNPTLRVKSIWSSLPTKKFGSHSLWKLPSGLRRAQLSPVDFITSNNKRRYWSATHPSSTTKMLQWSKKSSRSNSFCCSFVQI